MRGIVQGVGFRPFVLRLARRCDVRGWVRNEADGVWIHAEASGEQLARFLEALRSEAPPAARIVDVRATPTAPSNAPDFAITSSESGAGATTAISPDLCVCPDCLREMRDPRDPRFAYPYINCTNCGPRFSIVLRLPYDRENTVMRDWPLCPVCHEQYADPADRRFHAQPIACPRCGPCYQLFAEGALQAQRDEAIRAAAQRLARGEILGIKGVGGYHVACDARNARAIEQLRARKFRKEKPFALMAASLAQAHELVALTPRAADWLLSVARPIVLAPRRGDLTGVAPGLNELGVMLPYAPLHELLFDAGAPSPLVLTSANRSAEPIAFEDDDARSRLGPLCDALLIGQRPIARRVDDSVVAVRGSHELVLRRARGLAPRAAARLPSQRPILAVGADLKNCVALNVDGELLVGPHIGDLDDAATREAFERAIDDLLAMYDVDPATLIVAHDAHPQYFSTRYALARPAARRVAIQHHAAHVAATLVERGEFDRRAVGLALDGTGYGTDGAIWGGEVLVGSAKDGFSRHAHLRYVPLPGGDAATRRPVQCAAAYLATAEPEALLRPPFDFPPTFLDAVRMVNSGMRCFVSSSTGRLFDAAAAVLGFTREISYEGQAAIWLEQLALPVAPAEPYDLEPLHPASLIERLVQERRADVALSRIAARFHGTVIRWFADAARAALHADADGVVLTGGAMQNSILLAGLTAELEPAAPVLVSRELPVNDGGICAGQAALAVFAPT